MSEQTCPEGWVLAWSFAFVVPNMAWQHRDGRLTGNPDRTTDWRDSGWFADPRMKPVPDKPEPPIENGWWLMCRKNDVTGVVVVWERRDGGWRWADDGARCFDSTVEKYVPVFRLTDEQAALLHERAGGESRG